MNSREHLVTACGAAAVFWIVLYFMSRFNSALGFLPLIFAAGNLIVVASILGYIKPWRKQITNLAFADAVGVIIIAVTVMNYVNVKLSSGGLQNFAYRELLIGTLLLALMGILAVKGWYTWEYASELKSAGVPQNAGKLPATLQIVSGALVALFAGGCTMMIGGFKVSASTPDFWIIFIFGWLPLIFGLIAVGIGIRRLSQA